MIFVPTKKYKLKAKPTRLVTQLPINVIFITLTSYRDQPGRIDQILSSQTTMMSELLHYYVHWYNITELFGVMYFYNLLEKLTHPIW